MYAAFWYVCWGGGLTGGVVVVCVCVCVCVCVGGGGGGVFHPWHTAILIKCIRGLVILLLLLLLSLRYIYLRSVPDTLRCRHVGVVVSQTKCQLTVAQQLSQANNTWASKLVITRPLCGESTGDRWEPPLTCGFPTRRVNTAESDSMPWDPITFNVA